eukprot:6958091-Alexandrium_andersonii.AAC.1
MLIPPLDQVGPAAGVIGDAPGSIIDDKPGKQTCQCIPGSSRCANANAMRPSGRRSNNREREREREVPAHTRSTAPSRKA